MKARTERLRPTLANFTVSVFSCFLKKKTEQRKNMEDQAPFWVPKGGTQGWGPELWGPNPRKMGPGWALEGWGAQHFAPLLLSPQETSRTALPQDRPSPGPPKISLFFSLSRCGVKPRRLRGRRGLHTTIRELQTRTLKGSGLQNRHQNSTRRHPERHKKSEMVAGEGKKERNFGGPAGPVEGGPAEGGPGKSKPATTTTTPNPEQVGPRRAGPLSQARFGVWVFGVGYNNTTTKQQNNTTQQHNNTTTPENLAKTLKH